MRLRRRHDISLRRRFWWDKMKCARIRTLDLTISCTPSQTVDNSLIYPRINGHLLLGSKICKHNSENTAI